MQGSGVLKPGDRVLFRGAWGADEPREATVRGIEHVREGRKDGGEPLAFVPWCMLAVGRRIVVDLDTGGGRLSWAYGYQLQPVAPARRNGARP